jgi:hypothetical protein
MALQIHRSRAMCPEREQRTNQARGLYPRADAISACLPRTCKMGSTASRAPAFCAPHVLSAGSDRMQVSASLRPINQSAQRPCLAKKAFSEHSLLARPDAPTLGCVPATGFPRKPSFTPKPQP